MTLGIQDIGGGISKKVVRISEFLEKYMEEFGKVWKER